MLIRFGSDADPTCMQMDEVSRRCSAVLLASVMSTIAVVLDQSCCGRQYACQPLQSCLIAVE